MVGCSENHPVEFASQSHRQPATANAAGLEKTEHVHPVEAAKTVRQEGVIAAKKALKNGAYPFNSAKNGKKNGAYPFTCEAGWAKGCESAPKTEHVRSPGRTITS